MSTVCLLLKSCLSSTCVLGEAVVAVRACTGMVAQLDCSFKCFDSPSGWSVDLPLKEVLGLRQQDHILALAMFSYFAPPHCCSTYSSFHVDQITT